MLTITGKPESNVGTWTSHDESRGERNEWSIDDNIHVQFDYYFNRKIVMLPRSLVSLELGKLFNHNIDAGVLPSTLRVLVLGDRFNKPIGPGVLPDELEKLVFGSDFNNELVMPMKLLSLTFGHSYNRPITWQTPILARLQFGMWFNQPIPYFECLEHLVFGDDFNQPIDSLSPILKSLRFGLSFDQPLENLPYDLESVHLGYCFNSDFKCPPNLKHLHIGPMYSGAVPYHVPTLEVVRTLEDDSVCHRMSFWAYQMFMFAHSMNSAHT